MHFNYIMCSKIYSAGDTVAQKVGRAHLTQSSDGLLYITLHTYIQSLKKYMIIK